MGVFSLERKHKALQVGAETFPIAVLSQDSSLPSGVCAPVPGLPGLLSSAAVTEVSVRISGCCGTKPACAGCLRLRRSLWEEQNHFEDVLKDYPAPAVDLHRCCTEQSQLLEKSARI